MNAIVVTFDRLPLGFLGCCGNGWIETANFDRLAAQSVLFHQHFSGHPTAQGTSQAWWNGRDHCPTLAGNDVRDHPQSVSVDARPLLARLCAEHGVTFRLLLETEAENGSPLAIP